MDTSGYASLGVPVGGHSIDLVESGLSAKFFRGLVNPVLFLCTCVFRELVNPGLSFLVVFFRGVNLLAFAVFLNREVRRPLPIAGDWGVATRRTTGQIYPVVLSALGSNLVTVFNGGGKYIPSPEQVGRLSKFSW